MLDPVLSEDALIMPCKAILKACALSIPVSSVPTHYAPYISCLKHVHVIVQHRS